MTSMQTVRKRLEQLEHEAAFRARKIGIAWKDSDGVITFERQEFKTFEDFETYATEHGYNQLSLMRWADDKFLKNLSPEKRAAVLARMKEGSNT